MRSPARPMRWLLVAALACVLPAPLLGQTRWREISSRPDSASLARFQTGFPDCGPSGRPANDEGSRLYEHIAHGNAYALQAALSQLGIREPEYARTVKVWSDELRAALAP